MSSLLCKPSSQSTAKVPSPPARSCPGKGRAEVYPPARDEDDSSQPFTALPPDERT